jgi:hypothetical protein
MAQGYLRYASEHLRYDRKGEDGLIAADWAVRLSSYAARPLVIQSAILASMGQREAALGASRKALKYGAMDPYVWQSHAQLKLRLGQMDDELTMALKQMNMLAPRNFWFQERNARLGLSYWNWGRPEHRALWAESIEFVLKTDTREFLRSILITRQEERFCREFRAVVPELDPWCGGALRARQLCYTQPVMPGLQAWCSRNGLLPYPLNG